MLLLLMEYREHHSQEPLPIIYPIIIYSGEEPYTASTDFFTLFGEHEELAREYLLNPIQLVDVCRMSDEDITNHQIFGLIEFAFKHKKTQQFEQFIRKLLPWINEIECETGIGYTKTILTYVMNIFPEASYEIFTKESQQYLGDETMITIAQKLRNEGIELGILQGKHKGMEEGIQQEKQIIARSMLIDHMPIDTIRKYTGLSITEINTIKKELKLTKH